MSAFKAPSLFSSVLTFNSFLEVYNPDLLDSSDRNQKSSLKLRLTLLKGRLSDIYNKIYRNPFFFLLLVVPENYKQCARRKHTEIHMFNISPWHKHTLRSNWLTYPLGISPYPHRGTQPHGSPRTWQAYLPLSVVRQSHISRGHRGSTCHCHKAQPGQTCGGIWASLTAQRGWNSHKTTAVPVGRDCWSLQSCCKQEVGALPALGRYSFVCFCLKNLEAQTPHRSRVLWMVPVALHCSAQGFQVFVAEV